MSKHCIHAVVSGKVQGVFFRDSTKRLADHLNVTGWIKNCANGTVELVACGAPANIEKLIAWLHQGPKNAHVDNVIHNPIANESHQQFIILYK